MKADFKMPFYAKIALVAISVFAVLFMAHIGEHIIIPLVYATIVAILLNPLVNYLMSKRISKAISISLVVVLALVVVTGIFYVVSSQISMFTETYPQLKEKFRVNSAELGNWFSDKFNVRHSRINTWTKETREAAISGFGLGQTLAEGVRLMVIGLLLPVYLFMILYYKTLLLEFIRRLFKTEYHQTVAEVLGKTKNIIQSYLVGLFFEMIIIAVLNSTGLLLLGIDYAVILGITGAIVNIIPYIGGIIAIALPMIIAYVTKESATYPAMVFFIYILIQFIDNHYIIPRIVASRVKINALVSVIVVLIGGEIWGVPGMFLSIPLTAILKVIFDHIEPLKPWGFLLGNIVPTKSGLSFIRSAEAVRP
jgi:predicted PurR-regulated permease PerM